MLDSGFIRLDQRHIPAQWPLPAQRRIWRFGRCVLDERSLDLTVDGQPVHVHRKALQVLMLMLRRAGELVTKEELATVCWPRRILSDTVLTTTVNRLRVALGDRERAVIHTMHGFGYRLSVPVRVGSAEGEPQR